MKRVGWALPLLFVGIAPAEAAPQPPHVTANGVTCQSCHIPFGGIPDPEHRVDSAATGGSVNMLQDAAQAWDADQWIGGAVSFASGLNQGKFRTIIDSGSDSLSWSEPLENPVAPGDTYVLSKITYFDIQVKCMACHNPSGLAPGEVFLHVTGTDTVIGCGKCHDPHNVSPSSGWGNALIRTALRWYKALPANVFPSAGPNRHVSGAPAYNGVCEACHTETSFHRNNASGDHTHNTASDCLGCHPHNKGFAAGACDSCHGAPPADERHLIHAGGGDVPTAYGSLEPRTNATGYAFNCGYCHPLDQGAHRNGVVEMELYNAAAPSQPFDPGAPGDRRAIKGENIGASYTPGPNNYAGEVASYTDGTCNNVYCHSEQVENAPTVPVPSVIWAPFVWEQVTPFMNAGDNLCCNGTADGYPDFTIDVTRVYRSPKWVGDTYTGPRKCDHCHNVYPRVDWPANNGQAGDSHMWVDDWGWSNGHAWNHSQGGPVQCRRCHADTVAAYLPPGAEGWVYGPGDIPQYNVAHTLAGNGDAHVNGKKDVAFDTDCSAPNAQTYYQTVPCIGTPTYEPATKTCNNVACHLLQTTVVWGQPYRWWEGECDNCHHYGGP